MSSVSSCRIWKASEDAKEKDGLHYCRAHRRATLPQREEIGGEQKSQRKLCAFAPKLQQTPETRACKLSKRYLTWRGCNEPTRFSSVQLTASRRPIMIADTHPIESKDLNIGNLNEHCCTHWRRKREHNRRRIPHERNSAENKRTTHTQATPEHERHNCTS